MSTGFVEFRELYRYAQNYRGDIVFYDRFVYLCEQKGVSPSRAAIEAGISKSLVTKWKVNQTDVPSPEVIKKLSAYFNVPASYILGEENEKTPILTKKDERDIARDVERIMEDLSGSGELMFDGVPMSEEAKAAMAAAMRIGFEEARRRNKATYTPKKYREE